MIYGLVVKMKIKQNGVWELPPEGIQWKQNGVWETGIIEYILATDDDFSGETNGDFRYIGDYPYVEIPHVIKGINITSYSNMFEGTSVKGVVSTNKNVTDMSWMFHNSQATSLDLSNFDTSSVMNMFYMFYNSQATSLDLSSFNTSSVTNMSGVFDNSQATSLDLSSFNTSNVENMSWMFHISRAILLDLSTFDTSSVTNMGRMFRDSSATTGYARTQADADKFNSSSNKPAGLNFVVHPDLT